MPWIVSLWSFFINDGKFLDITSLHIAFSTFSLLSHSRIPNSYRLHFLTPPYMCLNLFLIFPISVSLCSVNWMISYTSSNLLHLSSAVSNLLFTDVLLAGFPKKLFLNIWNSLYFFVILYHFFFKCIEHTYFIISKSEVFVYFLIF